MTFRLKKSQCANKIIFSQKHELDTSKYVKDCYMTAFLMVALLSDLKLLLEQQSQVITELIHNFKV